MLCPPEVVAGVQLMIPCCSRLWEEWLLHRKMSSHTLLKGEGNHRLLLFEAGKGNFTIKPYFVNVVNQLLVLGLHANKRV